MFLIDVKKEIVYREIRLMSVEGICLCYLRDYFLL